MKSDKEFWGEKRGGIQKIIKTELLDSPLFYLSCYLWWSDFL